jgi:hypothetical protein
MLTRRDLIGTAITGSAAVVTGASVAQAFSAQPMPPDVAASYALGCAVSSGAHDPLLQAARALLRGEIAQGLKPAGSEEIVSCPLCGCRMVVAGN